MPNFIQVFMQDLTNNRKNSLNKTTLNIIDKLSKKSKKAVKIMNHMENKIINHSNYIWETKMEMC